MSTTATITKSTTFPYKKTMEDSLKRRSYNFRCYNSLFYDPEIST